MTATTTTVALDLAQLVPEPMRTCEPCLQRLQERLERQAGVEDAEIDAIRETLHLRFDAATTSVEALQAAAMAVASDLEQTFQHQTVPIAGMHCADCASTLERGVGRLDGVDTVAVNFMSAKMDIEFDARKTSLAAIDDRVRQFGYRIADDASQGEVHSSEDSHGRANAVIAFLVDEETRVTFVGAALTILGIVVSLVGLPAWLPIGLYAGAILIAGLPVARKGLVGLRINRQLDINILMTIAVIGAAVIGEWLEAATVVVLFSLGEALEDFSMDRARHSIRSLMSLTPKEATVRRNGRDETISVDGIVPGDLVIIRPGGRIPIDGVVMDGHSQVNQAPVTGESMPVEKEVDAQVFSGTINGAGVLEVRATRPASDSMIARIIHMVEEAQAQKAPSQRFVDVFAKYYTPAVVVLAALLAIGPPLAFDASWSAWGYRALVLLVIACPCALVISTPVSIVSAIAAAARNGVLIKGGAYLEALGSVRAVAFDKTGTLTIGQPRVQSVLPLNGRSEAELLQQAAAAERYSEHPLGEAIVAEAMERNIPLDVLSVEQSQSHTGAGIAALVADRPVQVGTRQFVLNGRSSPVIEEQLTNLERQGQTAVLVSIDGEVEGIIGLADELRPEAKNAVTAIHKAGVQQTVMLTGDRELVARMIAAEVGIDEVRAELLPDQKVEAVVGLLDAHGSVAMVGDGINDAPALARATVGIAMGAAGTDTALETADVALMGNDLTKASWAIHLSRKTKRIITENIAIALGIKAAVLVLAVAGLATLWQAIFADVGASLIVILNGLRLLRQRDTHA